MNPGGISSQWCVTRTIGGLSGSPASAASWTSNRSRAPRSRPANGSSSRSSSGSLISARASRTCWRSPSEITPNGRSPMLPTPPRTSSRSAFSQSAVVYSVPPGLERAVTAAHHHVSSAARSARSCRVTAPLTRATRGRSVRTSTRPRRAPRISTDPGRRPQPSRRHLEQRRLARPVRPEDHPAVAGVDPPVHAGQHRHTVAADRDAVEHRGRAPRPLRRAHTPVRWTSAMRREIRPMRPEQHCAHVRSPANQSQSSRR